MDKIKTLFVVGPTASGKTEYAIRLAKELDGEIVSADSMQIYKYMDIGSAKPTAEERKQARHFLVDEIDPRKPFNAFDFKKLALSYISDISSRGKLPIVCGGTGLYINALVCDMDFSAPEGSASYRDKIFERFGKDPVRLHEYLKSLDENAAAEIPENNVKRALRAVERLEAGEEKLAPFRLEISKDGPLIPVMVCVTRERQLLYSRIDERVERLIEAGLEDEVRSLMAMGFTSDDIAMKGIGYKEIMDAAEKGGGALDAKDEIKLHTRHLAKRQLTWFKRYEGMRWFDPGKDSFSELLTYIKTALNEE